MRRSLLELLLLLDDRCVALRFLRGETIASSLRIPPDVDTRTASMRTHAKRIRSAAT